MSRGGPYDLGEYRLDWQILEDLHPDMDALGYPYDTVLYEHHGIEFPAWADAGAPDRPPVGEFDSRPAPTDVREPGWSWPGSR